MRDAQGRPSDVADGILVPEGLASYPSGHTLQGFALWGLLVLWWTRSSGSVVEKVVAWSCYVALMLAIGVARVVTGAHHPTDILGGAVLGLACLGVAAFAERGVEG